MLLPDLCNPGLGRDGGWITADSVVDRERLIFKTLLENLGTNKGNTKQEGYRNRCSSSLTEGINFAGSEKCLH